MALAQYLEQLRRQLKDFPTAEQADLLDEINSHIQSAEQDPTLDADPHTRQRRIEADLGSPVDLGRNLNSVHRPARLVDFLLVFIPVYLLFPLVLPVLVRLFGLPVAWSSPAYTLDLRFDILVGLVFTCVAVWRRSPLLLAFWLPDALIRLITLLTREQRWFQSGRPFLLENLIWFGLFLVLTFGLTRLLWQNRRDFLLVVFAVSPFIGALFNVGAQILSTHKYISQRFFYWTFAGISVLDLVEIASLAGFFLLSSRIARWTALWVGVLGYSTAMVYAYWPSLVLVVWWCGQAAEVLGLAWLDSGHRRVRIPF